MAYNGSGTFLINTAGQPVVSGTVISSTAFNALTADLATGLSTAITKDGQTTVTANIPMSTYKFTGLGVGSAATDSANLSQVQSTVTKLLNSVSGADTITATASPTLAAYAAGQMFYFVAAGDNTTSVTLNIDSLGAKAVTRDGATALAASDIKSGEVVVVVYDGTRFQVVSQLNSAGDARFANVSIASSLYVGGVSTFVGNAGFSANVSITSALSVGGVAAITGATTIGGNLTLSGGTANGVLYLNGSKVATSGSALVFDGTNLGVGAASPAYPLQVRRAGGAGSLGVSVDSVGAIARAIQYYAIGDTTSVATGHVWYYRPATATDTVGMTLNGDGNLGIGTASPGSKLTVSGDIQILSTNYLSFSNTAQQTYIRAAATNTLAFGTSSAEQMRLDSSGNLGIGTASPGYRLHVERASAGITGYFYTNDGASNPRLVIYGDSNGTTLQHTFSSGAASLIFAVGGSVGVGNEVGRVDFYKNWTLGGGTLATSATDGFLYVPTCAGTPTGTPTTKTGFAPIVVNTTNNKLYFYSGGAWRDAGP